METEHRIKSLETEIRKYTFLRNMCRKNPKRWGKYDNEMKNRITEYFIITGKYYEVGKNE